MLVVFAVFMVAAPAAARVYTPLSDSQLYLRVEQRLQARELTGVIVRVERATVTLSGTVPTLWAKREAVVIARQIDGVKDVLDVLTVAAAAGDGVLADRIAAELRGCVLLSSDDQVAVSVEHGVVTVAGVVTVPYKSWVVIDIVSHVNGVQRVVDLTATDQVSRQGTWRTAR